MNVDTLIKLTPCRHDWPSVTNTDIHRVAPIVVILPRRCEGLSDLELTVLFAQELSMSLAVATLRHKAVQAPH